MFYGFFQWLGEEFFKGLITNDDAVVVFEHIYNHWDVDATAQRTMKGYAAIPNVSLIHKSVFKYLRDRSKDFSNFLHEVSAP